MVWKDIKTGKIVGKVKVKDIPELQKKLKPYGFILKPYFSSGMAITNKKTKQDIGVGIHWLKYFKWRLSNWISNNGIWLGLDYKITNNFGLGGGVGESWKGDNLLGFRFHWEF